MNISTRFAVAIHILALIDTNREGRNTSDWIAGSVGTNPVVIRRISSMLGKAGLIEVKPGIAGAKLARPAEQITLLEIYQAVDAVGEGSLFAVHEHPSPECPVGQNIAGAIIPVFLMAQQAMEDVLQQVTLAQISSQLPV
ncbi:Rrf2 family transcriptional regulator [Paenibacillus stellifer]|uniref:Rrf2 family transcriptional regulator n=1 Tax=Paenibacillus stellifer TaxID=169760 RepID=A0A089LU54_9BACL|nr:Rrf2 family transcriptional regulator [Paenibacillus stellifer]AIQ63660.1 Rrf2 family transcriptional regulator [Paenibacillus stellifer]